MVQKLANVCKNFQEIAETFE